MSQTVVKDSQSHFDLFTDFDIWDQPGDGHKDKLKSEMLEFQISHTEYIDEGLLAGSKIHNLATLSLAASITFICALVKFVSDTFK